MNVIDIMKRPAAYASGYENIPGEEQNRAKQLCWEYNRTASTDAASTIYSGSKESSSARSRQDLQPVSAAVLSRDSCERLVTPTSS